MEVGGFLGDDGLGWRGGFEREGRLFRIHEHITLPECQAKVRVPGIALPSGYALRRELLTECFDSRRLYHSCRFLEVRLTVPHLHLEIIAVNRIHRINKPVLTVNQTRLTVFSLHLGALVLKRLLLTTVL